MKDLVILGGGMAAGRLVRELTRLDYPGSVAVISEEPVFGYNRVLLPGYIGGDCDVEAMEMVLPAAELSLEVHTRTRVQSIDPALNRVQMDQGSMEYGTLVFATGSSAAEPAVLEPWLTVNRLAVRSLEDADRLKAVMQPGGHAVILGAGLLGLETASALLRQGMKVTVVHRSPRILNRQLDEEGSEVLQAQLENHGLRFCLHRLVSEARGSGRIEELVLDDGTVLPCDLVVMATGTTPRVELASAAGITCRHGIVVDEYLAASQSGHFAIGECAEFQGQTCGLVSPTHQQADVLAFNLCGGDRTYQPPPLATRLKVSGIELFSAGETSSAIDSVSITASDGSVYRRLGFTGETLVSAVLLGDTVGARAIEDCIGRSIPGAVEREKLAFGL